MLSFIVLLERAGGRAMVPQVNANALLGIKNNTTCPDVSLCNVFVRFQDSEGLNTLLTCVL